MTMIMIAESEHLCFDDEGGRLGGRREETKEGGTVLFG